MKIGVLLNTYNRTDDARINLEIIRNVWAKNDLLKDVVVVHSYNGEKEWWPEKYLEDELLYLSNPGHFTGAEILMNEGVKCFSEKYPDVEYVITLASDTWLVNPEYLEDVIRKMQKEEKYLATAAWGSTTSTNMFNIGMAIDFNIFNISWAVKYGLFPIRFVEFLDKYSEVFWYHDETVYLERVFAVRFKQAVEKFVTIPSENLLRSISKSYIYRMKEREPVHDEKRFFGIKKGRKMFWKNIGLITYHDPKPKKDILKKMKLFGIGDSTKRLLSSNDLTYYNNGFKRTTFTKGDKKTTYKD